MGAGERHEHQVLGRSLGQRAGAAGGGNLATQLEAVPVVASGLEAVDVHLDREVALRTGIDPAMPAHPAEGRIFGHLPAHALAAMIRLGRHPGPDDQTLRGRITGRYTMAERGFGLGWGSDKGDGRR